jgi:ankyrin repeat protein
MKFFLQVLAGGSLLGAIAAVAVMGILFVRGGGGGPYVGAAFVFLLVFLGAVAAVLVVVGLVASILLRRRGDARPLRRFAWFLGTLLVVISALMLFETIETTRRADQVRQAREAYDKEQEMTKALMADPAKLAAYVAQHGVNAGLPGTWLSPLEAAVRNGYIDLTQQMLTQGATVSVEALASAAKRGDAPMVTLLLAHRNRDGDTGWYALEAAFLQGRQDILRLLVEGGVSTNRFAEEIIKTKRYLQFYPGDVDWKAVLGSWNESSLPKAFKDAIEKETLESKIALPDFGEERVLAVLNTLVKQDQPANNPADASQSGPSPGNQAKRLVAGWDYLRDFHSKGAIGAPYAGKGFSMLNFLTISATDKAGSEGLPILYAAVESGDVELTDTLVRQGYNLKPLETNSPVHSLLRSPDYQPMSNYLKRRGIKISEKD